MSHRPVVWFLGAFAIATQLSGPICASAHAQAGATQSAPQAQAATVSPEDEEKARAHFRLGRAYYDNGAFLKAAAEFEAAYQSSQRPALLYNVYLAYRDANDTHRAADALRKYLQLEAHVENRGQLEARLAVLDRSLAAAPAASPAAAATTGGAQPTAAAAETPPTAQPSTAAAPATAPGQASAAAADAPAEPTRAKTAAAEPAQEAPAPSAPASLSIRASFDTKRAGGGSSALLPIALMGVGGAMVVGSIVTGVLTLGKRSDLQTAMDECIQRGTCNALPADRVAALEDEKHSGQTLAVVTDVLMFGGLAVAGTGAVLFLLQRGGQERAPAQTSAALSCGPRACLGTLRGRF